MPTKVFVSYCHAQADWVRNRLIPILRAGGTEPLFDGSFEAGKAVVGQMDATQDQADRHLLVLSPEYLKSPMCLHEMKRAVALDPDFLRGLVIPVKRVSVSLPDEIRIPNPLYVSLDEARERDSDLWQKVLTACEARWTGSAPLWLEARDETLLYLERGQSVCLTVSGDAPWRSLLDDLARSGIQAATVDFEKAATHTRKGLVDEVFAGLGSTHRASSESTALAELERYLEASGSRPTAFLLHFDRAKRFDGDFFAALRSWIDRRLLVVLFQSRRPFMDIVPADDPLSKIDLKTVFLGSVP